jgi:hypothetical protein
MKSKLMMGLVAALVLNCGPALAQVAGTSPLLGPPLGMTSPLGIGPDAPVGPPGVPLGATELNSPGLSPMLGGTLSLGSAAGGGSQCSGAVANMDAPMASTAPFDGGGTTGTASGTCANAGTGTTATGIASPLTPVPRTGIPMGATELSPGGLSPPPTVQPPNPVNAQLTPPSMPGSSLQSAPQSLSASSSLSPTSGSSRLGAGGTVSSSTSGSSSLSAGGTMSTLSARGSARSLGR